MKNRIAPKLSVVIAGLVLVGQFAASVSADPAPTTGTAAATPSLPFGATEVLKLVKAKVGDDTIVAYINHAPIGYSLSASDLIYLRSEGVSEPVMSAMLTHARPVDSVASAPAPAQLTASTPGPVIVQQAPPTTTYVQSAPVVVTAPPTVVYDYSYYPYYGYGYGYYGPRYYGPGVSLSFGFGGRGYYGGGYHGYYGGGYRGGFHGGGGFHGHR